MIRQVGAVLAVEAPISHYVIEPIRYALGLSRVGMVDDHLGALAREGRATSPDVDPLLEARQVFAAEATP